MLPQNSCSRSSALHFLLFIHHHHHHHHHFHSTRSFFALFHCPIVYVESFARVQSLSMSGRIMYHAADKFVVQWEGLRARYPRAVFAGVMC